MLYHMQLVSKGTGYAVRLSEDQVFVKIRPNQDIALDDIRQALAQISYEYPLSADLDDMGMYGRVIRLCSRAPEMKAEAIHRILNDLDTILDEIIRARANTPATKSRKRDKVAATSSPSRIKEPYRNRKFH